jgi:hypothetical protein
MPRANTDQLGWGNHDTVVTGTQDTSKQVSKIEWNDSTNQGGLFGFVKQSGTIATNAIVPSGSVIEIQADGTLNTLTPTNNNEFDLIYLIGKSGEDAITITHNASGGSGNIRLLGGSSKTLSTTIPLILMARTIGANLEWLEYGGGATVDAGDLTGTTLASGVITSSLTTVGTIGTGAWQGTAVGDTYISSASTWNGKQDALTFGIADTNKVQIDGSGTSTGQYSKFTTTGVIGASAATQKTDLSLNNVENTALSTWAGTSNVVTLGTVTTGTWTGTAPTTAYGGTGLSSFTAGDILYYASGTTLTKLAKPGTPAGEVLTFATSASAPSWAAAASSADTPWTVVHDFDTYYYDMEVQTKPADPAADNGRFYVKEVDTDNDGVFCIIRKNGAFEETQIV